MSSEMHRGWIGKSISGFCLGLLLAVSAAADTEALWVAEAEGTVKISTADGILLAEITEVTDVRAAAVDLRRSTVWLVAAGDLHAFGFDGQPALTIPVGVPGSIHAELAIHPADGAVWMARMRTIPANSPARLSNVKTRSFARGSL
jgi:hypothetical protein